MKNQLSAKIALCLGLALSLSFFSCKKTGKEGVGTSSTPKMKDSVVITKTPVAIEHLNSVETLADPDLKVLQFISEDKLVPLTQDLLYKTAQGLEGYDYYPQKIQDCSGMFRRYLSALRAATHQDLTIPDPDWVIPEPGLDNSAYSKSIKEYKNTLPKGQELVRNTKQFGKWYADLGQFIRVGPGDVEKKLYRDMIKPGMVMFYGYKFIDEKESYDVGDLKAINHMGVVVNVIKEGDEIVRYQLFHGRNDNKENGQLINPSAITGVGEGRGYRVHERSYPSGPGYEGFKDFPSLGFATQKWIGIAPITNKLGKYVESRDTIQVPI